MSSFQPPQICPQYLVCLRPAQKVKVSTQSNWKSVMIWMGKYFSFSGFYTFLNRKILWRLNCWGISWQADCWCNVSLSCSRYDSFMNYDYERDWNHEKIMNQFVVKIASKDFQFWEVTALCWLPQRTLINVYTTW